MSEAVICGTCPHRCRLKEGQTGLCRARKNRGGRVIPENYGKLTSLALDPIEKKPFARFYPGSFILSAGSYGCNLACPFCQNFEISQAGPDEAEVREAAPEALAQLACSIPENLGIAFTYNEPLLYWEYIRDTGKILKERDPKKKVALVSNGTALPEVIEALLPALDAANIDLKGDEAFYREELHGDLAAVKETIRMLAKAPGCHLEITKLVIPGKNDSLELMREEAAWIAGLDPEIPLHLSRYFPRYRYTVPETPRETILALKQEAEKKLRYVYTGNM